MSERAPWKVSIVDQDEVDPRTLVEHPLNPKIHTAEQDAVVKASLTELGWLRRVLWNRRTGHVLDGHERLKLAIAHGEATVPRDIADIPEADEGKVLLLLDQSANLAEPDPERWQVLRDAVQTEEPAISSFFASFAAQQGWMPPESPGALPPPVEEAEVPEDRLANLREKWPVEPGEIWAAGRHRLWCGDGLDQDGVTQLLAGALPTLIVADPPYGVSIVQTNGYVGGGEAYNIPFGGVKGYVGGGQRVKDRTGHYPIESWAGKKRDARKRVSGGQRQKDRTGKYPIETRGTPVLGQGDPHDSKLAPVGKYAPVIGDESTATAIRAATQYLSAYPQAVHVWWGGNYYADHLPASTCWLVWDKETTGHFADCELAWTNQPRAARLFRHRWNGMLRASEHERRWHPTQKPAALMAWVYEALGEEHDVVLDPFLGSGPTLIAAEQRGQTLYGIERSPDYISIALERFFLLTGVEPVRLEHHEPSHPYDSI